MLNNRNISRRPKIIDTSYHSAALLQPQIRERARPTPGQRDPWGQRDRWTFTVMNPPTGATNAFYAFGLRDTTTELITSGAELSDSLSESFTHNDNYSYPSGTYRVEGVVQYDEGGATHYVHADISGDQTITIP